MITTLQQAISESAGSTYLISAALGTIAAIRSGGQGGIVDELPPCDLLLTRANRLVPNGTSGDNVIIGRTSEWMYILLNSFYSRNLSFSYIAVDGSEHHPKCGCLMTKAPSCEILPNMFYGLVEDYKDDETDQLYKVVHRPECIPNLKIDGRATEFLTTHLHNRLASLTNAQAQHLVRTVIDEMCRVVLACEEANFWDKRIIGRIQKLLDDDKNDQEDKVMKNETIDRIYSRLPHMLERLGLNKYQVLLDGKTEEYNISDVTRSFVIFFGVSRAVKMSRKIYQENALVMMGYNIQVGQGLVRDLSELPAKTQVGYSSRLQVENTTDARLIEKEVDDNRVYYGLVLEASLSTSILALTGIGPVLSMYVGRYLTAPYRSSPMEMGTSMSWSVSEVLLHYTGLARDDWMACITPASQVNNKIKCFRLFAVLSTFAPVLVWSFVHPNMQGSVGDLGHTISRLGLFVGLPWVLATWSLRLKRQQTEHPRNQGEQLTQNRLQWIIPCAAVGLLAILVNKDLNTDWVYLYLLELLYAAQWAYGVTNRESIHQATALFMLGILGAMRLSSVA